MIIKIKSSKVVENAWYNECIGNIFYAWNRYPDFPIKGIVHVGIGLFVYLEDCEIIA